MPKVKNILCPVDFSDCSALALDYALALAKRDQAAVTVMHVMPTMPADGVYPYAFEPILPTGESKEQALTQLGKFVHRARGEHVSTTVVLEDGDPVDEILAKAKSMDADLIVIGTHGRRGLARLLLGSVAERVLRSTDIAVLSVSPDCKPPRSNGELFSEVLCPVDFSASSLRGLELALDIVGDSGSLSVVHVVEFYMNAGLGESLAVDLQSIRKRHEEEGLAKLEAAIPSSARERCRVNVQEMTGGGAYRVILKLSEREHSELIVMGVAGRSAADMFFFGSTTNHVVREARCPVLTVRSEAMAAKPAEGDA